MIIRNYSTFKFLEQEAFKKIDYLKSSKYISEMVFCTDLANDPSDFSLNGIYFKSYDYFYPIAAGFDIGCGFNVTHTNVKEKDLLKTLKKCLLFERKPKKHMINNDNGNSQIQRSVSLGYLSPGNHFIEIRKVSKIYDYSFAEDANIKINDIYIVIHNGINKNLKKTFMHYFIMFKNTFCPNITYDEDNGYVVEVPLNNNLANNFFSDIDVAQEIAKINREYIRDILLLKMGATSFNSFDMEHEYIKNSNDGIEHYKGAQNFCNCFGKQVAYIAISEDKNDYLVSSNLKEKCINHGFSYQESILKNNHYFEKLKNKKLPYSPLIELSPMISIKNGCVKEWI